MGNPGVRLLALRPWKHRKAKRLPASRIQQLQPHVVFN